MERFNELFAEKRGDNTYAAKKLLEKEKEEQK